MRNPIVTMVTVHSKHVSTTLMVKKYAFLSPQCELEHTCQSNFSQTPRGAATEIILLMVTSWQEACSSYRFARMLILE